MNCTPNLPQSTLRARRKTFLNLCGLCALRGSKIATPKGETIEYRRSSKWDQVIISLCGFAEYPKDIVNKVARIDPLLAVDCMLSGINVSLDDVIDGFIEATNDESRTLRKAALTALAKVGREQVIPYLAKALEDKDDEVSKLSANLLIQFGEPVIPYLINHLISANDDKVKLSIQALAIIGPPAIPVLSNLSNEESRIDIKIRACSILGKIKHKDSAKVLLSFLKSKIERLVMICIEGLGDIGEPSSTSELINFLDTVPKNNIELRVAVVKSLGNIRDPQAVPAIINLITDKSWKLHSATLAALRKIATPDALLPVKVYEMLNTRNRKVKNDAIEKIQDNYGITGLLHGLRSNSYWEIAHKLVKLLEREFEFLLEALNDNNHRVNAMIAYCIGERKEKKHEKVLTSLLESGNSFVKGLVIEALGKLKSEAAVPYLAKNLYNFFPVYSNSKIRVCDNAAEALLSIGTKEATSELKIWALKMIKGRIAKGQETPLIVLREIGDNDAIPRLAKILKYKDPLISDYARRALQVIGTPEALKVIEKFDEKNKS